MQPQSDLEIRPVVEALRRLDHRLDIAWNPRAVIAARGSIDGTGKVVPPRYDGRWEVRIRGTGTSLHDREYAVVYQVRNTDESYRAVGWWLVEFMQQWDAAQAHFRTEMDAAWAAQDAAETAATAVDESAVNELVERGHFAAYARGGRATFHGQGVDFAALAPPNGQSALIPPFTH